MRAVLMMAIVFGLSSAADGQESGLDRRIKAEAPGAAVVWLPDGISGGMFAWRIAESAGIPLVFEASPFDYRDPAVIARHVDLAGLTVREALDILVAEDPRYRWEDRDGIIVIRPLGLSNNPDNALNQRVSRVRGDRLHLEDLLARVTAAAHASSAPPTPRAALDLREFRVDVSSGTVLDVLVAAARAHGGVMWSVPDVARGPDQGGFSLGFMTFAGAGVDTRGPAAR
jgi:hypothetical protein